MFPLVQTRTASGGANAIMIISGELIVIPMNLSLQSSAKLNLYLPILNAATAANANRIYLRATDFAASKDSMTFISAPLVKATGPSRSKFPRTHSLRSYCYRRNCLRPKYTRGILTYGELVSDFSPTSCFFSQ